MSSVCSWRMLWKIPQVEAKAISGVGSEVTSSVCSKTVLWKNSQIKAEGDLWQVEAEGDL